MITICEAFDSSVSLLYKGKSLQYTTFKRGDKIPEPVSDKSISQAANQAMRMQKSELQTKTRLPVAKINNLKADISILRSQKLIITG